MLDVHRLRIFRSVVASGSIHAAAANLGYTASAVSQHVAALQRETGLTLVTRIGRGIEPTAAGRALAGEIDGVLARLGEVESVVEDLRAGRTGSLSISYFASAGAVWMPRVVRTLLRDFPEIRLDLALRDDLPASPAERSDVQIIIDRDGSHPPAGMRLHHLLDDPFVAIVPKGHPLAGSTVVELAQLAGDCWVDNDFARGRCRGVLIEACRAAGFAPPFHVETHDYATAIAFVDAGIGITVVPGLGATRLPAGAVAVPVTCPTPVRSIYAMVQTSVENTPPVRTVLAVLADCVASAPTPSTAPAALAPAAVEAQRVPEM